MPWTTHVNQDVNRRTATHRAFEAVPETCPEVESALADAEKRIKEQTVALRNALIAAYYELEEVKDRCTELEEKLSTQEDVMADMQREIDGLKDERDTLAFDLQAAESQL